ncbi:MAG: hypothetical protein ACM3MG_10165 [Bacillota bacterium]
MKLIGMTVLFCTSLQFVALPAYSAPVAHVSFFWEVKSWDSVLNLVTAATGNEKFEKGSRDLFKAHKLDLTKPFAHLDFDGNKVRFEGLPEPIITGATPFDMTYRSVTYVYNPKRSVKANFEEMRKAWGQFKELNFPSSDVSSRSLASAPEGGSMYASLFTFVGASAALARNGDAVTNYFGYKWFKNTSDPIKIECQDGKIIQVKGKDRLAIETATSGDQIFYSEIGGKKEIQGQLEKITLRGKESYAITNGNVYVNNLRISDAVELNKKLMAMKSLCSHPEAVEEFNISSNRIQDAINAGKVKVVSDHLAPLVNDPDAISGVR